MWGKDARSYGEEVWGQGHCNSAALILKLEELDPGRGNDSRRITWTQR